MSGRKFNTYLALLKWLYFSALNRLAIFSPSKKMLCIANFTMMFFIAAFTNQNHTRDFGFSNLFNEKKFYEVFV